MSDERDANPPRNGEVTARSADGGVESSQTSAASADGNRPLRPFGAPPRSGEDLGRSRHRTVGTDPKTVRLARKLRREMTLPEVLLWRELKGKPLGMKFRKQFGQLGFVADFACVEVRLVIEIDGIVHDMGDNPGRDLRRDAILNQHGWRVVRIAAKEVLANVAECAASIVALAASLRPLHHPAGGPPPRFGEVLEAL